MVGKYDDQSYFPIISSNYRAIKPSNNQHILDHIQAYVQNHIELAKLISLKKALGGISGVFAAIILVFFFLFFVIFASITIALVCSYLIGTAYSGFLIVTLLYLIVGVFLLWKNDKLIRQPISNLFIKQIFNHQAKGDKKIKTE